MVVAQLVERLLSIPEVGSLTPVIEKIYIEHLFVNLFIINCIEKTKINKKRQGIAQFLKNVEHPTRAGEGSFFAPPPVIATFVIFLNINHVKMKGENEGSVTRLNSPSVLKSCPKTISLEK